MKKEVLITKISGIIFISFGLFAIIYDIVIQMYERTLWFCYLSLILLGVGFIFKKAILIRSQLNILTIPLIIWTLDFLLVLIFGKSPFNITDYFFIQGPILQKIVTSQHLFTIPLAILGLKYLNIKTKYSKRLSIIQITLLFIVTRLVTNENINWVYKTTFIEGLKFYEMFWFATMIAMIFLTDFLYKQLNFKT